MTSQGSSEVASDPPEGSLSVPAFPVVGVGASAGGLEAVSQLLQSLPPDPGLALLVVLHLSPDFKSELPEVLGRASAMPFGRPLTACASRSTASTPSRPAKASH